MVSFKVAHIFFIIYYLFVYIVYIWGDKGAHRYMERTEDNLQQSVLSFYHVGPID